MFSKSDTSWLPSAPWCAEQAYFWNRPCQTCNMSLHISPVCHWPYIPHKQFLMGLWGAICWCNSAFLGGISGCHWRQIFWWTWWKELSCLLFNSLLQIPQYPNLFQFLWWQLVPVYACEFYTKTPTIGKLEFISQYRLKVFRHVRYHEWWKKTTCKA